MSPFSSVFHMVLPNFTLKVCETFFSSRTQYSSKTKRKITLNYNICRIEYLKKYEVEVQLITNIKYDNNNDYNLSDVNGNDGHFGNTYPKHMYFVFVILSLKVSLGLNNLHMNKVIFNISTALYKLSGAPVQE